MAVGQAGAQPFSARAAAPEPGHPGIEPGLVDEDQLLGVDIRLALEPGKVGGVDIFALLLRRMARLSLNVIPRR